MRTNDARGINIMDDKPRFKSKKFQCPHCEVMSQQQWFDNKLAGSVVTHLLRHAYFNHRQGLQDYEQKAITEFLSVVNIEFASGFSEYVPADFAISTCVSCSEISIWKDQQIVYPKVLPIQPPNEDLNQEIKALYHEASTIVLDSPRGAAALLRLALQMLMIQLGKDGKSINTNIKELVAEGLSAKIQQALDILRVVGNHAVHPGQIDLDDKDDVAQKLFLILNLIADEIITKPKDIANLYNDIIPEESKEHIDRRDGRTGDENT